MRLLLITLLVAFIGGPAAAQSLVLRPAVVALKGKLDQSVTQVFYLQNDTDLPLDFEVEAQDVVVRDGKRVFVDAGQIVGSIAATAVADPVRLHVAPHQGGSAKVTFTLPHDMQHRAVAAIFRGLTTLKVKGQSATMSLGALMTFQVSDVVTITGRLDAKPPTGSSNANFSSTLVNEGTEPAVPVGLVAVLNSAGRLVGKATFGSSRMLPGESTTLVADFASELDGGDYRAIATFVVDGKPLTFTAPLHVP